ncbi:nuclear transport factor 2 family protein [Paraflavitalea speifideaquila]|uniref:nuclear transport factor 2 family protein n=1 Tax=Paraflavitalea speifideaquila TaxID=3076558 RepID=UPI0033130108
MLKRPGLFQSIDVSEQTISFSGNSAIVRYTFFGKMTQDGKPGEITLKVLMVWQKIRKGKWVLLARQAVKI